MWALFAFGVVFSVNNIRKKDLQLLPLFAFPCLLTTIIFYRNAWPYYYVFIIPPVIVFCGIGMEKIIEACEKRGSKLTGCFVILFCLLAFSSLFVRYTLYRFDQTVAQKELIGLIHEIFPEPVPYIDRCSMISSFPKVGFFMSEWWMIDYTEHKQPVMQDIIKKHKPLFLIANTPYLDPKHFDVKGVRWALFEQDKKTIKENFIHHWGKLYVAGKIFNFSPDKEIQGFEILIPGIYTVEGANTIIVNNVQYEPGSTIYLENKKHWIKPTQKNMSVLLRWGENLHRPEAAPSAQPLFFGFSLRKLNFMFF